MLGSDNRMLQLGLIVACVAYLYSVYTKNKKQDSISVEQAIIESWQKIIQPPAFQFKRIVIGINCNVDLIVPGIALLTRLNATPSAASRDLESIGSVAELEQCFSHFFQKGAAAERYTSNPDVFNLAIKVADRQLARDTEYALGGNAALMAQKLASSYTRAKVLLVGPIGPRLKSLLHPRIVLHNSTKIAKDELHISMEYRQGEIWGDVVAPASSRFITSHDVFSSSSVVIEMFFNTIGTYKPDLIALSGLHLLEFQRKELWQDKLRVIKRGLGQLAPRIPIHLELGSMADLNYAQNVLHRIVPNVDSIGLNEQELSFLAKVGGGPYGDQFPAVAGAVHVYKAVEIMRWLLDTYGRDTASTDSKRTAYRLQRIHFHCLTYHMVVSKGADWSNSAAAVAAGARLSGRQACGVKENIDESGLVELRTGDSILLDKEQGRLYRLNPHNPLVSWMRNDILFIFSPTLVCKHPKKTVGLGDAISATALTYSQFYRFEKS